MICSVMRRCFKGIVQFVKNVILLDTFRKHIYFLQEMVVVSTAPSLVKQCLVLMRPVENAL